ENRLATTTAQIQAGQVERLALEVPHLTGIARITVFSDRLEPLAERLVFRQRGQRLQIVVRPDRAQYSPRDPVALEILTTDRAGHPVSADLALAVVDDTVLSLANDKTAHIR